MALEHEAWVDLGQDHPYQDVSTATTAMWQWCREQFTDEFKLQAYCEKGPGKSGSVRGNFANRDDALKFKLSW